MQKIGLKSCELWQGHIEPRNIPRDEMRRWRETIELDMFQRVREKFDEGVDRACRRTTSASETDFSDTEIERGFEMAKALGAPVITASSNVDDRRADCAGRRAAQDAGGHAQPLEHRSQRICDGQEPDRRDRPGPVHCDQPRHRPFHRRQRRRDRRFSSSITIASSRCTSRIASAIEGANLPFGEGDTPIVPVLKLLQRNDWAIPANIEYEYKGGDSVEEVGKCLDYCRRALGA